MATNADRRDAPDAEHPVLELTWEIKTTHRRRYNVADLADDVGDWFERFNDDESPLTAEQVHDALVKTQRLPEMFRDHLIQEAHETNLIDADMDDYDVRVAWVASRQARAS